MRKYVHSCEHFCSQVWAYMFKVRAKRKLWVKTWLCTWTEVRNHPIRISLYTSTPFICISLINWQLDGCRVIANSTSSLHPLYTFWNLRV